MKDEFLATLSHELRTPLNAVLGWANILRPGKLQGEELKQGLETIERNARVQAQLIEDLLDMSRIISGKVRLDVQGIDLPAVLNESIETLRATAEAKGIRLQARWILCKERFRAIQVACSKFSGTSFTTPSSSLRRTERSRWCSNASIHMWKSASLIPAKVSRPSSCLMFLTGFNRRTRRQLVDMADLGSDFHRQAICRTAWRQRPRQERGNRARGDFYCPSSAGCQSILRLTEERPCSRATPRENQPLPEVSLANVHVLVVDDEIDARDLVERLLEMAGATVSMAGSASEAMERILAARPDVLVCDIGMQEKTATRLSGGCEPSRRDKRVPCPRSR